MKALRSRYLFERREAVKTAEIVHSYIIYIPWTGVKAKLVAVPDKVGLLLL